MHEACEAADARGLTQVERNQRFSMRTLFMSQMLGNRAFVAAPNLPERIDGMSTQLILSLIMNAESRELLLERLPPLLRPLMNERACMQTYMVKLLFSLLSASSGGIKPGPSEADAIMGKVGWQHSIRSQPLEERGFHLPGPSNRDVYGSGVEAGNHLTWLDGSYPARLPRRIRQVCAAARAAAQVKDPRVRQFFEKK